MRSASDAFTWGELALTYRYLSYEQDDDKFIQKLTFSRFALGANFRFLTTTQAS